MPTMDHITPPTGPIIHPRATLRCPRVTICPRGSIFSLIPSAGMAYYTKAHFILSFSRRWADDGRRPAYNGEGSPPPPQRRRHAAATLSCPILLFEAGKCMNNARKGDEHESLLTATIVSKLLVFRATLSVGRSVGRSGAGEERKYFLPNFHSTRSLASCLVRFLPPEWSMSRPNVLLD